MFRTEGQPSKHIWKGEFPSPRKVCGFVLDVVTKEKANWTRMQLELRNIQLRAVHISLLFPRLVTYTEKYIAYIISKKYTVAA